MIRIIPAIDIINGRCVRLLKGDYAQVTSYEADPLTMARTFEDAGFTYLHLVDLDGARHGKIVNMAILEKIASGTSLHIDFGGGIRSQADADAAFSAGASAINAGSIAVKDPALVKGWIRKYGAGNVILGADVREGMVEIQGWTETSGISIVDFLAEYRKEGLEYVTCTDIEKDGLLQGPSTELYRELKEKFPALKIIASGGVSGIRDIEELDEMGIFGVVVGKAFYENRIGLSEVQSFLNY